MKKGSVWLRNYRTLSLTDECVRIAGRGVLKAQICVEKQMLHANEGCVWHPI